MRFGLKSSSLLPAHHGRMHCSVIYFVKSETPLSLVLGGIRTHNLRIYGLTTKPAFCVQHVTAFHSPQRWDIHCEFLHQGRWLVCKASEDLLCCSLYFCGLLGKALDFGLNQLVLLQTLTANVLPLGMIKCVYLSICTHRNLRGRLVAIYNHQADSPLHQVL